jgi:hypothetical protein
VSELDTPIKIANPSDLNFVELMAIWDTGATNSVITKSAAKKCGLIPVGVENVSGVTGTSRVAAYFVTVNLPNNITMDLRVTEGEDCIGCDVLIGMDVISKGDFCVTNRNGLTVLSFRYPSIETTDYVKSFNRKIVGKAGRNDKCPCGSGKKVKDCHGKNI